ncbi:hypothetical protein NDA11_007643 [Ustilago hordei]|nr:hypothetical protein NDA10_001219 [Ustilago hordei]KAJ1578015.1 hypothetical protein NDA12_001718 [Ustilago hordei]KAJ1578466.1 hypothetical protein NDA11_007643 [Ustilago hordei]KAJ1592521.1 hypothetical protein NDA15_004546 [Ustilago hordei]KAJ1595756.1 hypothetical protein NDA14_002120 [Ustilago hordei]
MYASAQSRNRSGDAAYGFATPVRTPSTSYHNPSSYSQALTPADASAKAVRFQSQPLPPQMQQLQQVAQQPSSSTSTALTPNRSPYQNASSASQMQSPSLQHTASATPNSMTSTRPALPPSASSPEVSSSSSIALTRRLKWNLSALALLWILPALTTRPRDMYWALLDQIYIWAGGETDEIVDRVVGWVLWALSVVLLFNAVEASVLVQRSKAPSSAALAPAAPQTQQGKGAVLGIHSPQVAKSINFVAASRMKGSPKTRISNLGAGSPIAHTSSPARGSPSAPAGESPVVDYSQFSPSLRRASGPITTSSPTSTGFGSGSGSTSSAVGGVGMVGPQSSPLAAFRARHHSKGGSPSPSSLRARSITPSVSNVDLSFEADAGDADAEERGFLGDESFQVDRALRSLRTSFGGVSSTPAP